MTSRITGYGVGSAKISLAPAPVSMNGVPSSTTAFDFGQLVQNSATGNWYINSGGGLFPLLTSASGDITAIVGTANQITAVTNAGTTTLSLPVAISAPGSLTTATGITATTGNIVATAGNINATAGSMSAGTTITAGTGITATTGNIVATAGAVNAGTTMTAGTGITATTGNIAASSGNVSASGTVTGGTGVTATTGNVVATAGAVNAGTSMTATLGNITATNGNLVMGTIGNKIIVPTGSNASAGTTSAMSGTPGAIVQATTACSATAKVFFCRATTGGTPGQVSITAQDGTGFTLTSTANETSTFNWWIINA